MGVKTVLNVFYPCLCRYIFKIMDLIHWLLNRLLPLLLGFSVHALCTQTYAHTHTDAHTQQHTTTHTTQHRRNNTHTTHTTTHTHTHSHTRAFTHLVNVIEPVFVRGQLSHEGLV